LAAAQLSRLRVREALVRIQFGSAEPESPQQPPNPSGGREIIDFARSTDRGQRVQRVGRDRIRILGAAWGNAEVSIVVDGRVLIVRPRNGDSPACTVERLSRRMERRYRLEVIEERADSVIVGVVHGL
jgi:hypothetical protein